MIYDLVKTNRSYRKFHEDCKIDKNTLEELVDLARLSGCGMNLQSLKFAIANSPKDLEAVYPNIKWAAFLKDWEGPKPGERPTGFIFLFKDTSLQNSFVTQIDLGIACQSILLGAVEKGLGGCMIGNIDKKAIYEYFDFDRKYDLQLIIALGKPNQNVVLDEIENGEDTKYWMDDKDIHHVPKRKLKDIIIERD